MLDLFVFTSGDILVILRFILALATVIVIPHFIYLIILRTSRAVSLGRFLFNVGGKIKCQEIPKYIMYCYSSTKWDIKKTWDNGNYWEGVGKWRYLDKEKGGYVNGRYSRNK